MGVWEKSDPCFSDRKTKLGNVNTALNYFLTLITYETCAIVFFFSFFFAQKVVNNLQRSAPHLAVITSVHVIRCRLCAANVYHNHELRLAKRIPDKGFPDKSSPDKCSPDEIPRVKSSPVFSQNRTNVHHFLHIYGQILNRKKLHMGLDTSPFR